MTMPRSDEDGHGLRAALHAVAISGALIGGLFSVMEGGWDGSRPRGLAKMLALLCTPGVLVGVWVRNKLKVPNSQ